MQEGKLIIGLTPHPERGVRWLVGDEWLETSAGRLNIRLPNTN